MIHQKRGHRKLKDNSFLIPSSTLIPYKRALCIISNFFNSGPEKEEQYVKIKNNKGKNNDKDEFQECSTSTCFPSTLKSFYQIDQSSKLEFSELNRYTNARARGTESICIYNYILVS